MKRREMLKVTGAALGLSMFPVGWTAAAEEKKKKKKKEKILYFTRSAGFEHGAVKRKGEELSFSEKTMVEVGKEHDVEVVCTKDGRVFDGDLDQYDAIAFYTSGDLTKPNRQGTPPMTPAGKKKLLETIAAGKGFVGFHAATDSFRTPPDKIDPYIAMIGGEFVSHGPQQKAKMKLVSPKFPGCEGLGDGYEMNEEWYALKKFSKDLHVILVQETEGMKGGCYQRPPFPATWARMHGKGRVFYTSMGHRDDVWTSKIFQQIVLGGFSWVMGHADAEIPPNIDKVTPKAGQLNN